MDDRIDAYTIPQFCQRHGFSVSFYHKTKAAGALMPRELRIGARVLISKEAAADWRRAREQATADAQPARVA